MEHLEGHPLRFGAYDGVSTAGGGVRKAGFNGSGEVWLSFSDFYKMAACFKSGVTLKGLGGVVANRCYFKELEKNVVAKCRPLICSHHTLLVQKHNLSKTPDSGIVHSRL